MSKRTSEASERAERMRAYKAEGHTAAEVAEKFGCSKWHAKKVCRGIAPQYNNVIKDDTAIRYINERTPRFEFAGNYTGMDGFVDLKCKACGTVMRKSFTSVKKGTATCNRCKQLDKETEEEKRRLRKLQEKNIKRQKRKANAPATQMSMRACAYCGGLFTTGKDNVKFCSEKCRNKDNNTRKADRRRLKIKNVFVDDISLEKTFERDGGRCWLCGELCDWGDYRVDDSGAFIAGNSYPSRDHVVPLNKGGRHEWKNIRLACRLCNSKKRDALTPVT